jgi:hypothetical protein
MQRPRAILMRSDIVRRTGSSDGAGTAKKLRMDTIVSSIGLLIPGRRAGRAARPW